MSLEQYADDLMRAAELVKRGAAEETRESAQAIGDQYKRTARKDTGAMAASVVVEASNGGLVQAVGPTSHYAYFNEIGTSSIKGDNALQKATDREVVHGWRPDLDRMLEELL